MNQTNLSNYNRNVGAEIRESLAVYTAKIFLWMFAGLMITFAVAISVYTSGWVYRIFAMPAMPFILLGAELFVVIYLSARLSRMSLGMARVLFLVYAILNGVVFSTLLVMYEVTSAMLAFALTAVYFAVMAAIGYFTKADLSHMRPILISGLLFLAGFWILSLFFPFSQFERVVCLIGIGIFLGCTAYDTQKIRSYYGTFGGEGEMAGKASIFAALQLYLDFINLFLYTLRFIGKRN